MAYNGVRLPGIFCPDESVEQFARLYGSDNFSKFMIMSSSSPYPNYQPSNEHAPVHNQPPGMMEVGQTRFYGSPSPTDERHLKVNPRYCAHAVQGSRPITHGACGDHYRSSPILKNHKHEYPQRGVQNHQEMHYRQSHHAHRGVQSQPGRQYHHAQPGIQNHREMQYHPEQNRHAHPRIQNHPEMQYHHEQAQQLNFMYPPPPGPRFPWL
ncbi:G-box-binding factor [Drosophila takahashii]|uniref:G-box-binding factor n=1 Tax=Drosophila takahashii TaxID=29030 RepID=UPI001CF82B01|nr:uncharacterized histidine-rich protein DDB_G0274557 [Drosophila takahashii]